MFAKDESTTPDERISLAGASSYDITKESPGRPGS